MLRPARRGAPGRSARSFDGGRTFHPEEEAECLVRLRLRGHPPHGLATSAVVDLHAPAAAVGAAVALCLPRSPQRSTSFAELRNLDPCAQASDGPAAAATSCRLRMVVLDVLQRGARGTSVAVQWRAGASACFDRRLWTPWSAPACLLCTGGAAAEALVECALPPCGADGSDDTDGDTRFFQYR
eukprot:SAG11_NODE_5305_length_1600_cov_2.918721_2_plen_184_part_00